MSAFYLHDDDVLLMYPDQTFARDRISKVGETMEDINDFLWSCNLPDKGWVEDGVECQVLQSEGGGWKKGKIKLAIRLEFIPDEPETTQPTDPNSPLADLRSQLNPE